MECNEHLALAAESEKLRTKTLSVTFKPGFNQTKRACRAGVDPSRSTTHATGGGATQRAGAAKTAKRQVEKMNACFSN